MQHTFLFEEGHWFAKGIFLNNRNSQLVVTGEMHTTHQADVWLHESVVYLNTARPIESVNCGQVVPFAENQETTVWKSSSSMLGVLEGKLTVVSNTIISSYQSLDNFYRGTECFIMLDDNCYENKGLLFTSDDKVFSWLMRLNRH